MRAHRAAAAAASLVLVVGCARTDSGVRAVGDDAATTPTTAGEAPARPAPSEPKAATAAYLTQVAETTNAQQPGTYSLRVAVSGPGVADGAVLTIDGAFDVATGRSRTSMDLSGLFAGLDLPATPPSGGDGDFGRALGEAFSSFFRILTEPFEIIQDGDMAYVRSSALAGLAGDPSKPWLRTTGTGELADGLDVGPNRDTAASLVDALRGAGADVTELGTEQVGGVETTHYRATIDPAKAADELPAGERDRFLQGLQGMGVEPVPFDIWVDRDDRVRRIEASFHGGAEFGNATITAEFGGYGEPQPIELPPADQVQDAPKGRDLLGPN